MPSIRNVELDARNRLAKRAPAYDARAPYREAIANLMDARLIEIVPDEGETLRRLKLLVSRAAKEVCRDTKYGETDKGSLVVWLDSPMTGTRKRRGRPPGSGQKPRGAHEAELPRETSEEA